MKWNFYIYHSGNRVIYSVRINDKFLPQLKEYLKREDKKYVPESSIHCEYCLSFIIKMLENDETKSYLAYQDKNLSNNEKIVYSVLYGFREKAKYIRKWLYLADEILNLREDIDNDEFLKNHIKEIENIFYKNFKQALKEITIKTLGQHNKDILIKTPFLGKVNNIEFVGRIVSKNHSEVNGNDFN
ncbi:hypothetical protein [Mycoplasmopsis pullorum]|uniref:hypothetical protein n=1 Tax=Mycoplasmopsis pullorum TaxID=48003 RepID=UPI00111A96DE|nr:hypothetical protein [Mycoplasmopsis pullorum]TNK82797.1 hypothetical protein C4M93_03525 [Mycoplasmopsis pullorum]TNK87992.1 hypothetical protein C4M89_03985 [Mycoplasmopsis pullorum]TNK91717.1 hypothetical protein C4M96_03670 [Mycoplasmopsis pullorum]